MDAANLADLYNLPLLDWTRIVARLDARITQAPDSGGPGRHTAPCAGLLLRGRTVAVHHGG